MKYNQFGGSVFEDVNEQTSQQSYEGKGGSAFEDVKEQTSQQTYKGNGGETNTTPPFVSIRAIDKRWAKVCKS